MKTKIRTTAMGITMAALGGIMLLTGFAWAKTTEAIQPVQSVAAKETVTAGAMDLVSMLTDKLGVTEKQASGGAGSLFGMARGLLSETDYGKVAGAIPGIGELIKAAPEVSEATTQSSDKISQLTQGLGSITDAVDKAKKYAAVYEQFKKLGLETDMVSRFVPLILSFVKSNGGETVTNILKSVWE